MKTEIMKWTPSSTTDALYVGVVELQDRKGEFHYFDVLANTDRLIFGGQCNAGFIESGFIRIEPGETTGDTLAELHADLEVYYNDGPQYVSRIVCNERM